MAQPDQRETEGLVRKVPMELFHLFEGQPQCAMVSDVYVSDKHLHKEIEMVYVLSGQVEVKVEERIFPVSEGELLHIRGSVLHQYLAKRPSSEIVKIKFMKEWLLPPFFRSEQKEEFQRLYGQVFKAAPGPYARSLVLDMMRCELPRYSEYHCFGKLAELTAHLLGHPELMQERMNIEIENLRYMESALSYMQDNCYGRLTLKMLADHLGLTESYCSKYIRRNTGITFVEYLNSLRVNNAQRLLIYTDRNVTEIVEQTGFASVQTFNRVFKAQTGQSPTEYRRLRRRKPSLP